MLAVAVSTSVIGGALIVGDSVRASLREMTLSRLGGITHVLHSPRFVREKLADELTSAGLAQLKDAHAAPALLLPGSIERKTADGGLRRVASVSILGLRADDWTLFNTDANPGVVGSASWLTSLLPVSSAKPIELTPAASMPVKAPGNAGIVLGYRTALELGAAPGDSLSLWIELPSSISRDSLLGEREDITVEMVLTVEGVLPETAGASRFSLHPAQQLPYNAFVSLATFQQRLNLEERVASPRNPVARAARINTILAGGTQRPSAAETRSNSALEALIRADAGSVAGLQSQLQQTLALDDIGLRIRSIDERGYLSVESDSMILEDEISQAVLTAAGQLGMKAAPTLVYLANEFSAANRTDDKSRYSMYSIVAGLDFNLPGTLGPMRLSDGSQVPPLTENDIVLSDWLATDLQVKTGDTSCVCGARRAGGRRQILGGP
jgi:putative ABC transport system permease protein